MFFNNKTSSYIALFSITASTSPSDTFLFSLVKNTSNLPEDFACNFSGGKEVVIIASVLIISGYFTNHVINKIIIIKLRNNVLPQRIIQFGTWFSISCTSSLRISMS